MHGQDLHGAVDDVDLAGGQAALLRLGGGQEGQERRQRGARRLGGEPGRRLGERVEVGAGQAGVGGAHGDLDVEADRALDVRDQVGQRLVEAVPQRRAARRRSAVNRRKPSAE